MEGWGRCTSGGTSSSLSLYTSSYSSSLMSKELGDDGSAGEGVDGSDKVGNAWRA